MKRKCLDIQECGRRFQCIHDDSVEEDRYRLYEIRMKQTESGVRESKRQIARRGCFADIIATLYSLSRGAEIHEWWRVQ